MTAAPGDSSGSEIAPRWAADEWLLGFARALRAAGLPVTADRERTFLVALREVGLGERRHVYWTGRATLTSSPADVERYDQVFTSWFSAEQPTQTRRPEREAPRATRASLEEVEGSSGPADGAEDAVQARASGLEVLRHRDVAALGIEERQGLARLFGRLRPRPPRRRARRHVRSRTGEVDGPGTLREQLRRMGEPGRIHHRVRGSRPRRVVLLIDVSGSMSAYADSLLRLAHTYVQAAGPRGPVEVFTMGTRLTHVTRALRVRDADRALIAAGEAVPDWSGGTRLGESIAAFLDRWGRRGMARGAVVVVFSDGWERQGPELLGEQMRRLAALAHRVVWSNPHRGKDGYLPVQQGIIAALPHVDDFVAGHSLAAFEELIEVVARA
ncbi:vWA domain-containing protein [Intrasporangium calvum]|uniref:VWA containing CoxE family protein n=1 Tax=Intrasporangium calvum (strain ATCC 23552 / DSM 43043 / JCM 3097 / NBRC 12989 / NCIMB 10167 / NRRL B-3866 / 7 KIP) TaxID=710696 RepID=E6SFC7_INTC7|nr:VWA domain-containing protein [Intrasporangium calvum]ADU46665.1 VWA containing CoxE family protein [Intrasporangium calvum DSM 43043]AXG15034.1 VWA domain-containing protein [Intrasporangium calvum]